MTTTREQPKTLPAPDRKERRSRDPWFDNTKLLLVTLVVVGHSWALLPAGAVTGWLYDYLYLWHMPAFLMVTGYLSRSFDWSPRHLRKLATGVLVPYLVFEGALVLFRWSITGADYDHLWLEPHWPMWFLMALLIWRLVTPVLNRLSHPVTLAVAVSLAGGLVQLDYLELDRVLGFLPFFVIGLVATPEQVDRLRTWPVRLGGLGVIGAACLVPLWVESSLRTEWLYYRSSYHTLGVGDLEGVAVRGALLAVSVALALAFLSWIPGRHNPLTRLGGATIIVYLFHGFAVKGAEYSDFPDWAADHALLAFVLVTAVGVALSLLLACPPVAKRLGYVVEPTTVLKPLSSLRA